MREGAADDGGLTRTPPPSAGKTRPDAPGVSGAARRTCGSVDPSPQASRASSCSGGHRPPAGRRVRRRAPACRAPCVDGRADGTRHSLHQRFDFGLGLPFEHGDLLTRVMMGPVASTGPGDRACRRLWRDARAGHARAVPHTKAPRPAGTGRSGVGPGWRGLREAGAPSRRPASTWLAAAVSGDGSGLTVIGSALAPAAHDARRLISTLLLSPRPRQASSAGIARIDDERTGP